MKYLSGMILLCLALNCSADAVPVIQLAEASPELTEPAPAPTTAPVAIKAPAENPPADEHKPVEIDGMEFATDDPDAKNETTQLEEQLKARDLVNQLAFAVSLDQPNYILPYYYTASPDQAVYEGDTPDGERINQNEFKFQFSINVPIWHEIGNSPFDFNFLYTQMSYWQVYVPSAWFRETDYQPALNLNYNYSPTSLYGVEINHQSNGRGGSEERSWNRFIMEYTYSRANWMLQVQGWVLIFKGESSDLHNPDITDYMGHGRITASYMWEKLVISLYGQNFEVPKRSQFQGSISYPVSSKLRIYLQGFSGYGQSLIEYNHRTNAAGIGIALNDWMG